jgi:hypothetical protein
MRSHHSDRPALCSPTHQGSIARALRAARQSFLLLQPVCVFRRRNNGVAFLHVVYYIMHSVAGSSLLPGRACQPDGSAALCQRSSRWEFHSRIEGEIQFAAADFASTARLHTKRCRREISEFIQNFETPVSHVGGAYYVYSGVLVRV